MEEKNDFLEIFIERMEKENIPKSNQIRYLKKIIDYLNYQIDIFKENDTSHYFGFLLSGMGIGLIMEHTLFSILLLTVGTGSSIIKGLQVQRKLKENSIEDDEEIEKIKEELLKEIALSEEKKQIVKKNKN